MGPGDVNAHTHLYSALVPFGIPLPEPWPRDFVTILERLWWRLDRALDADLLRVAARVYVARSLLAGTTTLIDHHESPGFIAGSLDVLAAAADELGARALLCYGATERNGGRAEAEAGLAESARAARTLVGHPRLRGLIGLHAGFTVSDLTIIDAVAIATALGVGIHVHVAEAPADVADARTRGYAGALARLDALGAVGPRAILAHGIHLGRDEVARAGERDAFFVQNPRSNRGNGVGYPSALALARHVALGSDGFPAVMDAEVAVAREDGARQGEPPALAGARLDAGRALVERHFGKWGEGGAGATHADVVARDAEGALHVVVDGRIVVRDRALVACDTTTLEREAAAAAARLRDRMAAQSTPGEPT
ncbi:MAG: amidohydrolase family protein [Deltaproteobacteria bacterium]|nr:amidohydrolase family protein [Deltaproteobacteria bacterium]